MTCLFTNKPHKHTKMNSILFQSVNDKTMSASTKMFTHVKLWAILLQNKMANLVYKFYTSFNNICQQNDTQECVLKQYSWTWFPGKTKNNPAINTK